MAKGRMSEKKVTLSPQQLLALYQNQRALMDSLVQQEQLLQDALQEVIGAETALKEIDALDKSIKSLVSLGSGVFVEAEITSKKVKSEIGGGVVQSLPIKKALKQLEEKRKKAVLSLSKLQKRKRETASGLARLEVIMQQLQKALQEKQKTPQSVS